MLELEQHSAFISGYECLLWIEVCVTSHFESVFRLRVTCGCLCSCGLVRLFFFFCGITTQWRSPSPECLHIRKDWLHPLWFANVDYVFEQHIYWAFEFKEGFKRSKNSPFNGLWSKGCICTPAFPRKPLTCKKNKACWLLSHLAEAPLASEFSIMLLCHFLPRTLTSALRIMRTSLW